MQANRWRSTVAPDTRQSRRWTKHHSRLHQHSFSPQYYTQATPTGGQGDTSADTPHNHSLPDGEPSTAASSHATTPTVVAALDVPSPSAAAAIAAANEETSAVNRADIYKAIAISGTTAVLAGILDHDVVEAHQVHWRQHHRHAAIAHPHNTTTKQWCNALGLLPTAAQSIACELTGRCCSLCVHASPYLGAVPNQPDCRAASACVPA